MMKVIAVVLLSVFFAVSLAQVTLQASSSYEWYQPYAVQWSDTNATHSDDDYVGIYNSTGGYQDIRSSVESGVTSGTINIDPVPLPGQYFFAYVRADGTIASQTNFTVVANVTLSAASTVTLGQAITINYQVSPYTGVNSNGGGSDYIALYDASATQYDKYIQWNYVKQTNGMGSVTFYGYTDKMPSLVAVYRADKDEAGTYGNQVAVQVVSGVTITPRHPRFGLHEDIIIDYTAPANHSNDDYIYIYKDNIGSSNDHWMEVADGSTSGNVTFSAFTATADLGTYYVTYKSSDTIYVANNTFTVSVVGSGATALSPCFALVAAFVFVILQFLL